MMTGVDLDSVVYCLFASLIWAPAVLLGAAAIDRRQPRKTSELIWLGALAAAILPTLAAPALSAAGISLRTAAPEPVLASATEFALVAAAVQAGAITPAPMNLSFETVIGALGLIYVYGALLAFVVWLFRTAVFSSHVARAKPAGHRELEYELEDWSARLGVDRELRIRKSDAVSSVCVHGFFRPVILIPSELDAKVTFDDLVMMGAHEIAHVRRGDTVFFAVCALTRIVFWFNPFLKRIAARAELAAEQSADQLVLEAGADRRAYAACFVEGLKFAAERARAARVAVPSFTPFDRKSRRDRLDAILSGSAPKTSQPSKLLIASAATFTAAIAFAQAAFAVDPERARSEFELAPLDGEITLAYGDAAELGAGRAVHEGVDIKAPMGAPIVAPADGVVIEATDVYQGKPAWGKVLVIRHRDGLISRYAHLGEYLVRRGDKVRAGDVIAKVGATGAVTGPHLHFETLLDGERIDPLAAVPALAPRAKAALAPSPAAAPEPAPNADPAPEPSADFIESLDLAPLAPVAPAAPRLVAKDGEVLILRSADGTQHIEIRGDDAPYYLAGDGEHALMSDADRKRLRKSLEAMREDIARAKEQHAAAMEEMRKNMASFDFGDFEFDGYEFAGMDLDDIDIDLGDFDFENFDVRFDGARLAELTEKEIERWKRDQERARRDVERARRDAKRAREDARREREEARREAEHERREALEEARRDREEARLEREEARREREREREEARRELERERREARIEREETLRHKAQALAEAERDIVQERARVERLLAEIEAQEARD